MKKIILSIDGMTCSACSNGLEKYLNKQNGIYNASVNLVMANATIDYDEKILNQEKLDEFVKKAGFKSLGEFKEIKFEKKSKNEKIKFIIFTILAIILMYISMGHMINLPTISLLDPHINPIGYMVTLLLLTIAFLYYGFDIIKNGYKNLIHKTPNMDTLVGIGVITSFLYSLYNMYLVLVGESHQIMNLYFESSAIVIYFVKLGRYIDGISKDKTKEAIQKLVIITPNKAIIKVDGVEKQVTLDEIKKGNIVVSKAGEKIAVDGEIVAGKAHFDESFITGESKPVTKEVGDKVVIIGGGLTGCEIAYDLHKKGKTPIIVEAKNDLIAVRGVCLANSSYLRDYFKLHNVEIHLESFVKEANENGVIIKTKEGKEITVPCDSVILSIGYNPAPAFKKSRKVHYVGDCSKVGNLRTVVWEAWKVATKL